MKSNVISDDISDWQLPRCVSTRSDSEQRQNPATINTETIIKGEQHGRRSAALH